MDSKTPVLLIPISPSGGGKSTRANELLKLDPDLKICSADHFFSKSGKYEFNPAKLGEAHQECQFKASAYMGQKKSVYVDNTNLRFKDVEKYVQMASIFGHSIIFLLFDAKQEDLPKLVERNVHRVPEKTIQRQFAQLKEIRKSLSRDMGSRFPGIKFTIEKIKVAF